MRKFLLAIMLATGLTSIANAEKTTVSPDSQDQVVNVLAFSETNNKVTADNVLDGKNEFLVVKVQPTTAIDWHLRPNQKFLRVNNQEYVVLEKVEDLTALEDENGKDGKLDKKDKNFNEIYAASFVGTESDKKLKLAKFSDKASAILIKKGTFAVETKKISDLTKGAIVGIKAQSDIFKRRDVYKRS